VDIRLYLKEEIRAITGLLAELNNTLTEIAKANRETVMPGYTHLQRAQPVTLAFHLLAYREMFRRDIRRFENCYDGTDSLPLGSGALAGTTYNTDRDYLAETLGFSKVCRNAMDAVSDRDFALEFLSCCSIAMMHLSRFCEELILWSSSEFRFIEIDDAFSTGSSIMPQKKNPDMAELIRGKTGRVYGDLMTLLTIMKGLPLAYNKDMQEDKQPIFDAGDSLKSSLTIFTQMIATMKINADAMENAAKSGFMNATDAADYLAKKGMPFREAHEVVGKLVLYCEQHGVAIGELSLEEMKKLSPAFEEDIFEAISLETCVEKRACYGGPNEDSVKKHIARMKEFLIQ
jgi:argininosuccinate lyase